MYAASPALHVANLTGLIWLRSQCTREPSEAIRLFDLQCDSAVFYGKLSDPDVDALCADLDVSLFVPRFNDHTLRSALAGCSNGVTEHHPSDLELHNLAHLQTLCGACQRSLGDAVWTYRLNVATATAYQALDHAQVVALCRSMSVAALVPRYSAADVGRILTKPMGTRALFAAAYETDVESTGDAVQRSAYLTR